MPPNTSATFERLPHTFRVGTALAAGVGKGSLRSRSLVVPFHGVRSVLPEIGTATSANERMLNAAQMFLPRLRPGEAISHTSALLIYGCPIRVGPNLHVTSQPTHARSRVRGVYGHEWKVPTPVAPFGGIPLALPGTALRQSASDLSLLALVVAIDHLRRPRGFGGKLPPLLEVASFSGELLRGHGRGVKQLLRALDLSRDGAESRMETLTRLLLLAYGLDVYFEQQVELVDGEGTIGRFDLVDTRSRTIVEFDGDHHRTDKAQHAKDLYRLDRAREAGYRVLQFVSGDIIDRPKRTATRVAAALGVELRPNPLREELLATRPS